MKDATSLLLIHSFAELKYGVKYLKLDLSSKFWLSVIDGYVPHNASHVWGPACG